MKDLQQMSDSQDDTLAQAEDLSDDSDLSYTPSDSSLSSDNLELSVDFEEVIDLHRDERNHLNQQITALEKRIEQQIAAIGTDE